MKFKSLDPRVSRTELPEENEYKEKQDLDQWQTYEVFHQKNRGEQHVHVGIVHAPNHELAILFAKEQYARRMKCVNLWVVKTADVFATEYEDSDMFEPSFDKSYREAFGYQNKELIQKFKEEQKTSTPATSGAETKKKTVILKKK